MSDSIGLCTLNPEAMLNSGFYYRRHELYSKLSALIDEGRWFFPNNIEVNIGHDKHKAFQGVRENVLNAIVEILTYVQKLNYNNQGTNKDFAPFMVKAKRLFVSEIQQILNPRKRDAEFKKLMKAIVTE